MVFPEVGDLDLKDDYVLAGATNIVKAMRWMSWDYKKEALDAFYQGLRGTNTKWVKTDDKVLW